MDVLSHPDAATAAAPRFTTSAAPDATSGVRCLVLGAGGFLGHALCAALQDHGAVIHAYGRSLSAAPPGGGASWTEATFEDGPALAAALRGQEMVFHLLSSSLPESSNRDPAADVVAQVVPSILLLERCRDAGVRKVVFASSGGVGGGENPRKYGDGSVAFTYRLLARAGGKKG